MHLETILLGFGACVAVVAILWAMRPVRETNPYYVECGPPVHDQIWIRDYESVSRRR